ncbi:MAG: nucleoside deaminase [Alphaproteobacteria bacterium]
MTDVHTRMMHVALEHAQKAANAGEVPVGAVIYRGETILAVAHNHTEAERDPTAHAELLALHLARVATGQMYLEDCTIAVTLEPCAMCMAALCWARVGEVRFGAYDVKSGGTVSGARVPDHAHHKPIIVGGMCEAEAKAQLQAFFQARR